MNTDAFKIQLCLLETESVGIGDKNGWLVEGSLTEHCLLYSALADPVLPRHCCQASDPVRLERGLQQAGSPQSQGSSLLPTWPHWKAALWSCRPSSSPQPFLGLDESCCTLDPQRRAMGKGTGLQGTGLQGTGRAWQQAGQHGQEQLHVCANESHT